MHCFTHFVNLLLSLRDPSSNVCKFSLLCPNVDPSPIENCLCYAARHNVQNLHVWATGGIKLFKFPACFINSESIKVLKLVYSYDCMPLDKSLRLPALKTLHLNRFSDASANFITVTVGNCPNLETLILDYLVLKHFNITAPQLKKLELCYQAHCISESYESDIVISAPMLTSFKLKGNASPVFSETSFLPCLENVYVELSPRLHECFYYNGVKQRMPLTVMNMLGQFHEAKSVTLSMGTLEVLAMDLDSLRSHPSPFPKLKHLKLIAPLIRSTFSLPLSVVTYLTQGSHVGTPWL